MEKRNLTCIGCPMGCALLVEMDGKEIISVTGNTCKKGAEYAVKEVTNPTRIVTTTVRVKNGSMPVVSVKTAQDIPKGKIFDCVEALRDVCANHQNRFNKSIQKIRKSVENGDFGKMLYCLKFLSFIPTFSIKMSMCSGIISQIPTTSKLLFTAASK